jgi:hypothetical protein
MPFSLRAGGPVADDVAYTQSHDYKLSPNKSEGEPVMILEGCTRMGAHIHSHSIWIKRCRLLARGFRCNGDDAPRLHGDRALIIIDHPSTPARACHDGIADIYLCRPANGLIAAAAADRHLSLN